MYGYFKVKNGKSNRCRSLYLGLFSLLCIKRSKEVLARVLEPEKKMRIMYKTNLNFERFDRYFQEFLRKGLVEQPNGSRGKTVYATSGLRGVDLLDAVKRARDTPKNLLWHKLLKPLPISRIQF